MSINSVHANLEVLKSWLTTLGKDKKNDILKKEKNINVDTKAKK